MRQQHWPGTGAAATAASGLAAHGLLGKPCSGRRTLRAFRTLRGLLPGTLLVGALAACDSSSTAPPSESIAAIEISPDSISLATGGSQGLSAQARTQSGTSVSAGTFFWSTSDSLVATVNQQGVVAAHAPGVAQIGASADGMSGFAHVVVVLPVVKTVVITPAADTIYASQPGDTAKLTATGYDADGHVLAGTMLWSISGGLATVSGGTVVGTDIGAGAVTVTATTPDSGNAAGTASVLVIGHIETTAVSPGFAYLSTRGFGFPDTVRVAAILTDTFRNNVSGQRVIKWTTNNPTVATVNSHGLVTAVSTAEAEAQITATTPDGSTGSMAVLVFP